MKITLTLLFIGYSCLYFYGQNQICDGFFGNPIFTEDFGTSPIYGSLGPELSAGTTTYLYSNNLFSLNDGQYSISTHSGYWDWLDTLDHTTDMANTFGYMMVVNASYNADTFYTRTVDNLCAGQSYQFSAWIINLNNNTNSNGVNPIQPNVDFQIRDMAGNILTSVSTGPLPLNPLEWMQFTADFQLGPADDSVQLIMINNVGGGYGNDLAIDDITLSPCTSGGTLEADPAEIFTTGICAHQDIELTAHFSDQYSQPNLIWQISQDGGLTWNNISGIIDTNTFTLNANIYQEGDMIRYMLANAGNINNTNCVVFCPPSTINIEELEPPQVDIYEFCENENVILPEEITENKKWYSSQNSPTPIDPFSIPITDSVGTFTYWISQYIEPCESERVPLTISINPSPYAEFPNYSICENDSLALFVENGSFDSYYWLTNPPIYNQELWVNSAGTYTVVLENNYNCSQTYSITVEPIPSPQISNVIVQDQSATIVAHGNETLLYSLEGEQWQYHNVFNPLINGAYTAYVKLENSSCFKTYPFIVLNIYNFISPNGDGSNDFFSLNELGRTLGCQIQIYDRYGKMIYHNQSDEIIKWNGKYIERSLPTTSYWYMLQCSNGGKFNGWIFLKNYSF